MDSVPHLAWPLQFTGAAYRVNDQDTDAELMAAVAVITSFEKGFRIEDPAFGITDPTFSVSPVDADEIAASVAEYEPRADINVVVSGGRDGMDNVRIEVRQATGEDD